MDRSVKWNKTKINNFYENEIAYVLQVLVDQLDQKYQNKYLKQIFQN